MSCSSLVDFLKISLPKEVPSEGDVLLIRLFPKEGASRMRSFQKRSFLTFPSVHPKKYENFTKKKSIYLPKNEKFHYKMPISI
jgi:hypothetical protein